MFNRANIAVAGLSVVCAALAVGTATKALSQPNSPPVTVIAHQDDMTRYVNYGDLNLTDKAARSQLVHRVGLAVVDVCPGYDAQGPYDLQLCEDFAWSGAWPQIRKAFQSAKAGDTAVMSIAIVAAPASK